MLVAAVAGKLPQVVAGIELSAVEDKLALVVVVGKQGIEPEEGIAGIALVEGIVGIELVEDTEFVVAAVGILGKVFAEDSKALAVAGDKLMALAGVDKCTAALVGS